MAKPRLILPVENQVRELDAKLLLACLASRRGYECLIGWKGLIDFRVGRVGPSIYFAKSISTQNGKMLRLKRRLGHVVVAWDEEAVVHYPDQIYYARRVGEDALGLIDRFVAWGEDNRRLMEGHPKCDPSIIHVLGNPRADLLRPEFRSYFDGAVAKLKDRYGDFILVNTNFGSVNGYTDILNLMRPSETGELIPGRGSRGMPLDYAEGLFAYRRRVFEGFHELLPKIAARFPDRTIVLRPHPAENHDLWRQQLSGHDNVVVEMKGNVVPWLLACACLVHNGCTTAVEGHALGTRVISYVPEEDERYEFALPNRMGARCATHDDVLDEIEHPGIVPVSPEAKAERRELLEDHICSLEGELACNRILDMIETVEVPSKSLFARLRGIAKAEVRAAKKRFNQMAGAARYDQKFMRQRFPKLTLDEMQDRADRLLKNAGVGGPVVVSQREQDLFAVRGG